MEEVFFCGAFFFPQTSVNQIQRAQCQHSIHLHAILDSKLKLCYILKSVRYYDFCSLNTDLYVKQQMHIRPLILIH